MTNETSAEAAAQEVIAWLDAYGIPCLDALPDDASLRDLWLSGRGGLSNVQRLVNVSVLVEAIGPPHARTDIVQALKETARSDRHPVIIARLRELGELCE